MRIFTCLIRVDQLDILISGHRALYPSYPKAFLSVNRRAKSESYWVNVNRLGIGRLVQSKAMKVGGLRRYQD